MVRVLGDIKNIELVDRAKEYLANKYRLEERAKEKHKNARYEIALVTEYGMRVVYKVEDIKIGDEDIEFVDRIDKSIGYLLYNINRVIKEIEYYEKHIRNRKEDLEKYKKKFEETYGVKFTNLEEAIEIEKKKAIEVLKKNLEDLNNELEEYEKELKELEKEYLEKSKEYKELLEEYEKLNGKVARKIMENLLKDNKELLERVKKIKIQSGVSLRETIERIALARCEADHYFSDDTLYIWGYDENNIELVHERIKVSDLRRMLINGDEDVYKLVVVANKLKQYKIVSLETTYSEYLSDIEKDIEDYNRLIEDTKKKIKEIENAIEYLESKREDKVFIPYYFIIDDIRSVKEDIVKSEVKIEEYKKELEKHLKNLKALLDF